MSRLSVLWCPATYSRCPFYLCLPLPLKHAESASVMHNDNKDVNECIRALLHNYNLRILLTFTVDSKWWTNHVT